MTDPSHNSNFRKLFQRERRAGDIVFASLFFAFALFLLWQLGDQVTWSKRGKLLAQPAFWPTISIMMMVGFGALHLLTSYLSPRIQGRWQEVWLWVRTFEYCAWFLAYVRLTPILGYLLATVIFTNLLMLREGYRSPRTLAMATGTAVAIVLLFKTFLQVKIPSGAVYEYLPTTLRAFMITYF